jgi:hypothetical protein
MPNGAVAIGRVTGGTIKKAQQVWNEKCVSEVIIRQ